MCAGRPVILCSDICEWNQSVNFLINYFSLVFLISKTQNSAVFPSIRNVLELLTNNYSAWNNLSLALLFFYFGFYHKFLELLFRIKTNRIYFLED